MIRLVWNNSESRGEIVRNGGPIELSDDLSSAVMLSVFSDAPRAGDVPAGKTRGGWWADRVSDDPNDVTGSRLWQREKMDEAELVEQDVRDSLAWMLRRGIASELSVHVEPFDHERFYIRISIVRPDGTPWSREWEATLAAA